MNNAAPALDSRATGWFSEAKYMLGGSGHTSRREARKVAWLKRQVSRAARRNDRRELARRLQEM